MPTANHAARLEELRSRLTPKQAKFAEEYARNGGNGTQAAIFAGYAEPEPDELGKLQVGAASTLAQSAGSIAAENLRKVQITDYLDALCKPANLERAHRIMSAQERAAWLTRVIEGEERSEGKDGISRPAAMMVRVQATNELNRMTGAHAAVKLDVTLQLRDKATDWIGAVLDIMQRELGLTDAQIERLLPELPALTLNSKTVLDVAAIRD